MLSRWNGKGYAKFSFTIIRAQLQSLLVRFAHRFLVPVLLFDKLLHHRAVDIQQLNQGARPWRYFSSESAHGVPGNFHCTAAASGIPSILDIDPAAVRRHRAATMNRKADIRPIRSSATSREYVCAVHRHHQVVIERPRRVPRPVHSDLIPGRQTLNIRRKQILPRNRHAHPENRLHNQAVRAGRTGPVDIRQLDRKVVNAATHTWEVSSAPA